MYPWCLSKTPPYPVEFENDQWVVLDSNTIKGETDGIDDDSQDAFTDADAARFSGTEVLPMGSDCRDPDNGVENLWIVDGIGDILKSGMDKRRWLAVHRPILGLSFQNANGEGSKLHSFQCELANVLSITGDEVTNMAAIVSGHFHNFQLMQYKHFPAQLVFGNGGTQLATPLNGEPSDLQRVSELGIRVLGDEIVNSPIIGQFGYGILQVQDNITAPPTMTARFLSNRHFRGSKDVTSTLPLRSFAVPGRAWRSPPR